MAPEFAQHAGSARESASRQADLERLIAKAEYECYQLRRELVGVMAAWRRRGRRTREPPRALGLADREDGVGRGSARRPARPHSAALQ